MLYCLQSDRKDHKKLNVNSQKDLNVKINFNNFIKLTAYSRLNFLTGQFMGLTGRLVLATS